MNWEQRLRDIVLAGGALATVGCLPVGGGACCNANSDPCCAYLHCGAQLDEACACQLEGGTFAYSYTGPSVCTFPREGGGTGDDAGGDGGDAHD
jgi:hypothetical protein